MLGAYLFFKTEMGSALRMTGSSPKFLIAVGRNISVYRAVLVSAAGVFVSLSGALLSFHLGFVDVAIGNGTIIVGIASLIIGEKICGRERLGAQIGSAAVGIVLYELAAGVALSLGISATDVKLATGIITISLLGLSKRDRDRFLS
jgi:putative ABC transport system permease protein